KKRRSTCGARRDGTVRRGTLVRRRGDHAVHLGVERGRRTEGRDARVRPFVVPLTIAILVALFVVQRSGTARVAAVFAPITLIWFVCIFVLGIPWIVRHPEILRAISPVYGVRFFLVHRGHGFLVLGSVVL